MSRASPSRMGPGRRLPVPATSLAFRVTSVKPWTSAVAAMSPSTTGSERRAASRPHSSATPKVHRENPLRVGGHERAQPAFQPCRGRGVPPPDLFDSASDLRDHENAQIKVVAVDGGKPISERRILPLPLPELGNDVRVEQVAQSFTARAFPRRGTRSRSVPTSGMASRVSLRVRDECGPARACRRISRCSASADPSPRGGAQLQRPHDLRVDVPDDQLAHRDLPADDSIADRSEPSPLPPASGPVEAFGVWSALYIYRRVSVSPGLDPAVPHAASRRMTVEDDMAVPRSARKRKGSTKL